ncbi:unnamed protein product [Cylindrotheca closterium]|uniref:Uncharacterized protein n=1 Tax=Cylindrotheca closterium TaxID=2856 RepID=A0AAD2G8C6_9STRA|nr:unnamed protein product [Cylindrotheca closterium]
MNSNDKHDRQDDTSRFSPPNNKHWKVFFLLVAVCTFQWLQNTYTGLPYSYASFVPTRSSKSIEIDSDNDSGNIQHHRHDSQKQEAVVDETTKTMASDEDATTILFIHYHKTGNNFVVDLLKQIHRTHGRYHNLTMKEPSVLKRMKNNNNNNNQNTKGHLQRGQEKRASAMIGKNHDDMDDDEFEDEGSHSGQNETNVGILRKRSHDPMTGCPVFGDDTDFEIGAAYRLVAPNFFCNLSSITTTMLNNAADNDDDDEMEHATAKFGTRQNLPFPPWKTTKIVHFVRDPIDMALSNYLYHSQHPTPEPWIKRKGINPCKIDEEFLNYTLQELNSDGSRKITEEDLLRVSTMCRYYKHEHAIAANTRKKNNTTRSFYGIMRRLPPYDGLRFATSHFLMAQGVESGGDLLRMPNNILRLREWEQQQQQQQSSEQLQHILTISMENIVKDMGKSVLEICDFILGHISNVTARSAIAQEIEKTMVARYQAKTKASKFIHAGRQSTSNETAEAELKNNKNWTLRQQSHVTQGIMNETERELLKEQLESDASLGHILLQLREVVDSSS